MIQSTQQPTLVNQCDETLRLLSKRHAVDELIIETVSKMRTRHARVPAAFSGLKISAVMAEEYHGIGLLDSNTGSRCTIYAIKSADLPIVGVGVEALDGEVEVNTTLGMVVGPFLVAVNRRAGYGTPKLTMISESSSTWTISGPHRNAPSYVLEIRPGSVN